MCKRLFCLSKTFDAGVVPAWFHVVPIVFQQHKRLFFLNQAFTAGVVPAWFHVVPIVLQQHKRLFFPQIAGLLRHAKSKAVNTTLGTTGFNFPSFVGSSSVSILSFE